MGKPQVPGKRRQTPGPGQGLRAGQTLLLESVFGEAVGPEQGDGACPGAVGANIPGGAEQDVVVPLDLRVTGLLGGRVGVFQRQAPLLLHLSTEVSGVWP